MDSNTKVMWTHEVKELIGNGRVLGTCCLGHHSDTTPISLDEEEVLTLVKERVQASKRSKTAAD